MNRLKPRRLLAATLSILAAFALALPSVSAAAVTPASTSATLRDVAFVDASVGYAAGSGGTVLKTTDGGATWTTSWSGGAYDLRGVAAAGSYAWAVTRDGALVRTSNGGTDWYVREYGSIGEQDVGADFYDSVLNAVDASGSKVFAAGSMPDNPPMVYLSSDSASSFPFMNVFIAGEYEQPPNVPEWPKAGLGEFYGVDLVDSAHGWAVGHDAFLDGTTQHSDGVIWKYDTTVETSLWGPWFKQAAFAGGPLLGVSFGSTSWGIAVGSGGRAYYTTNGGTTWTPGTTGVTSDIRAVATASMSLAWAVTDAGTILRTTDGGATWGTVGNAGVALHGVSAVTGTTAVAVGDSGTIMRTTNGTTWTLVGGPTPPAQITSLSSSSHPNTSAWYASRTAAMSWTASSATGYSYELNQAAATTPDTVQETTGTSASSTAPGDGVWYFHVRGKNSAGEWGAAAHYKLQMDATKPTLSHNAQTAYTTSASIALTAADTGGSAVDEIRYTLDGGTEVVVSGSSATVNAGVGAHTLNARSYDNAGTASDLLSRSFTVYAAATVGTPSSSTHPSDIAWYPSRSATFSWTGSNAVSYQYVFGTSSTPSWTSPSSTTASTAGVTAGGDGEFWFHVRGVNGAGTAGTHASRKVRIDATKPTLSHNGVSSYTSSASIALTAADTGGSAVDEIGYTLDGGTEVVVSGSSATVNTSVLGPHTLTARSYDNAGNASDQVSVSFTVYSASTPTVTKPTSSTHPSESAWYASRTASLAWTSSSATAYSYVLDQVNSTTPDAVQDTTGTSASVIAPADGVWYFHVRGWNASGGWGAAQHYKLQIDATKPTLATNAQTGYTTSASIALTGADTGGSAVKEIRYRLDGGTEVVVSGSSATVSTSVLGSHTLTARTYDNAGNASDLLSRSFSVNAPVTTQTPISGATRYETAVKVSQQAFPSSASCEYVIIATGLNWPDALGGAALSKAYNAPILLVTKDAVPSAVGNEIVRLGAKKAIILGGYASVSTGVESGLRAKGVTTIDRIGGANRYDTSRRVASRVAAKMGTAAFPKRAFVATGANFADALAASPISAKLGWPIFLVGGTLTSADVNAMKAIGVTDVTILGGYGAVSGPVETGLKGAFPGRVVRIAGNSRYETAVKVASYGINLNQGLGWDKLALAVGDNFPDALAGGVLQGRCNSVMLLTPGKTLDLGVKNVLVAHKAEIHEVRFLGGLLSITQTVRTAVMNALK